LPRSVKQKPMSRNNLLKNSQKVREVNTRAVSRLCGKAFVEQVSF